MANTQPKGLYRRLLSYVKPYWPAFVVAAFGNIIYAAVDSYSTYLFKPILDKGFIGKDLHFLKILPLIVLGLFVCRGLGSFLSTYWMGWIGRKTVLVFRSKMFNHLLLLPSRFFDNNPTAKILAKMTYNVDQITQATSETLVTLVRQSAFVIGLLTIMFITSWRFTLLVFLIVPVVVLLVNFVSKRFRRLSMRIQNAMGDINHISEETLSAHKDVKIYGAQDYQAKSFHKVIEYNFVQQMKVILTDALNTPIIQFMGALILALIIYLAFHWPNDMMSAGSFVTLLASMLAILKPIKDLTRLNSSIQKGLAAADSIFELLDEPVEQDTGTQTLSTCKGNISFNDVGFSYASAHAPVLSHIKLDITAGQTVAFVGRSGAGKTTVVNLLARFYNPTSGQITIDGTDISNLTLSNLRSHIALVSQHVSLFDDTVAHNIAYGALDTATEADVIAAAKAANAWGFIQKLPEGLNTKIGEKGLSLSGGQRQRLAIARAILKNAPILILDEATSALDNDSEQKVQAALDNLKKDRTTLVVAHRLSTVQNADNIVVMDDGHIIESGTHSTLLKAKGMYAQLSKTSELT
jgi:ATP-binding cassette, subfamily B, bacterial MsbA